MARVWFDKKVFTALLSLLITTSFAQINIGIGYTPSLSVSPLFVGVGEAYLEDADIAAELSTFSTDFALVQALLAGELDAAYVDTGAVLLAASEGVAIRIVAASNGNSVSFVADGDAAQYFTEDKTVAGAFRRYIEMEGRVVQIATSPSGSVPATVLQAWLERENVPAEDVEIFYMNDAQLQRSLVTDAVDAVSMGEPNLSVALGALSEPQMLASASELFAKQPGTVLIVRDEVISEQPELVQRLVDAHSRAVNLLNTDAERAAQHVQPFLGIFEPDVILESLITMQGNFDADPDNVLEGARALQDVQLAAGILETEVVVDDLVDTAFYDAANP